MVAVERGMSIHRVKWRGRCSGGTVGGIFLGGIGPGRNVRIPLMNLLGE